MGFELVSLIAFAVLGLGNVFHIIGLATPEWATMDILIDPRTVKFTYGLWKGCADGTCKTIEDFIKEDWLKACQAMAILGMLVGCVSAVAAGFIFVMKLLNKDTPKNMGLVSLLTAIASFILILICVIIYGVEFKDINSSIDFGYSFGLSITGAILIVIGGGVALAGNR